MTETIYFVQNGLASHNQWKPSSLSLSEGDTPDRLPFQATHPKGARADETLVIVLNPENKFNCEFYSV